LYIVINYSNPFSIKYNEILGQKTQSWLFKYVFNEFSNSILYAFQDYIQKNRTDFIENNTKTIKPVKN